MFRQDIARLAIFSGMGAAEIQRIMPYLVECSFCSDQVIFEQGKPAENLFILLTGAVVVRYKPYDGPPLTVANIQPGGVFGWSAALGREAYTSAAFATDNSTTLCMRGHSLHTICKRYPDTGKILLDRLAGVIAERLHGTHRQVLGILCQVQDIEALQSERKTPNDGKYNRL